MLSIKLLYKSPLARLLTGWSRKVIEDLDMEKDPLKAQYIRSIPEAQIYRGVLLQGYLVPANFLDELEDLPIRESDLFIITYPKSGTTWTEEIVSLIYERGDVRRVEKELLVNRVHHLEVGRPLGHSRFLKKLRSPRLMATHLPIQLLPRQLKNAKCKILYVMRNPKDTAVSYYHHHKMSSFLGNLSISWDQFLYHFMEGHVVYGSWFDHVLHYWDFCKRNPNSVFFLSYEELKLDLRGMVRRLSSFLEIPLSDEAVDVIVDHCSFNKMKDNKMVNREKLPITDLFDMTKSKFMRKGIIGDWKNLFTEEQSEAFDRLCDSKLTGCDLPIVFEVEEAEDLLRRFGRIIYNAPEMSLSKEPPPSNESDEDVDENLISDRYFWLPQLQLHLQPDPLTLDAFG